MKGGSMVRRTLVDDAPVPPNTIGMASVPDYTALREAAVEGRHGRALAAPADTNAATLRSVLEQYDDRRQPGTNSTSSPSTEARLLWR